MTSTTTIELLGTTRIATVCRRPINGYSFLVTIDLEEEPADTLPWDYLPEAGDPRVDGYKVMVVLREYSRRRTCFGYSELKAAGLELIWEKRNPNAARLKEIQEQITWRRQRYAEDMEALHAGKLVVLGPFRFNWEKGSWQAEGMDGDTRIVYAVSTRSELRVNMSGRMACMVERTLVNHLPTAGRKGFRLVLVSISHEHFDPEAEIKRLEAEIAAGRP